jgi:hypothetical protein
LLLLTRVLLLRVVLLLLRGALLFVRHVIFPCRKGRCGALSGGLTAASGLGS